MLSTYPNRQKCPTSKQSGRNLKKKLWKQERDVIVVESGKRIGREFKRLKRFRTSTGEETVEAQADQLREDTVEETKETVLVEKKVAQEIEETI
ncbi:hypothetical protein RRG08_001361 [Elysia crispata]|uniref:Uncharacterized protein n=1 Tax=Elysia crispata TaxID=231223 RepID=A0AAE1AX35_9GAST|nr:hypothetical protein RRG08_001361 [Elysia crispata]